MRGSGAGGGKRGTLVAMVRRVACVALRPAILGAIFLSMARPAAGQLVFEAVGERALGMGGAFVAVADDATAVHWNPAGVAGGQMVGMTIGWHDFQVGNPDTPPRDGATSGRTGLVSLATWPLGVSAGSYSRSRVTEDAGGALVSQSLRVRHVGVTVLQTLVEGLVVGSTLKVVRGGTVMGPVGTPTTGAALDAARALDATLRTTFDLDVGLMADLARVRLGLAVKNLRSPTFREVAGNAISVPRQARAGVSVRPTDGLTLAMDADLNTVDLMGDLRRMLAVGGEASLGSRMQVRSGARWNLAGDRRVLGAVGASVSVRRGLWVDAHYAMGRGDEAREMGVALRAGF